MSQREKDIENAFGKIVISYSIGFWVLLLAGVAYAYLDIYGLIAYLILICYLFYIWEPKKVEKIKILKKQRRSRNRKSFRK